MGNARPDKSWGAQAPLTLPQDWLKRLAGRMLHTPRKSPLPTRSGHLPPEGLTFRLHKFSVLAIIFLCFGQRKTYKQTPTTGHYVGLFWPRQVPGPGSLNFSLFINSVPPNTLPSRGFVPKSLDFNLKFFDFKPKSERTRK